MEKFEIKNVAEKRRVINKRESIDVSARGIIEPSVAEHLERGGGGSQEKQGQGTSVNWAQSYGSTPSEKVAAWQQRGARILDTIFSGKYGGDIESLLTNDAIVLDLGCGYGYNSISMATRFPVKVLGLDVSEEAINGAKTLADQQELHNCFFARADLSSVNLSSIISDTVSLSEGSMALALDFRTTQFLAKHDTMNLLDQLRKQMKLGGYFLTEIFTPNAENSAVAMNTDQVLSVYGKYFDLLDVLPDDGTNIYLMKLKSKDL